MDEALGGAGAVTAVPAGGRSRPRALPVQVPAPLTPAPPRIAAATAVPPCSW
ncbi:MAG: hypothetical protein JWM18_3753 [Chloroflexi bacterium]|jgi:hypothetical protein|nr:hypothetical protein [Chloroflexota bacterium]